jgi:ABC-2 type transport system ATP-binding protein
VGTPAQTKIRRRIGYLDEEPIFYDWMKVHRLSEFISSYFALWDDKLLQALLGRFRIDPAQKVGQLSKGNKVKLGLALALARRPSLLILDEPTSGLDPIVRTQVLKEIEAYIRRQENASVLFSSHLINELERICDRAVILDHGRIIHETELRDKSRMGTDRPHLISSALEKTFIHCICGSQIHGRQAKR